MMCIIVIVLDGNWASLTSGKGKYIYADRSRALISSRRKMSEEEEEVEPLCPLPGSLIISDLLSISSAALT